MAKISDECRDLAKEIYERAHHLHSSLSRGEEDAANNESLKLERLVEKFREAWER